MWGTGLRNRFFIIILSTLILAAIGINFVHVYFFKNQRLKLIDHQIAESSSVLLKSRDFIDSVKNPNSIEEAISRVLRGARIGKVFILRDPAGKIIYQSFNASLLQTDLPTHPEWVVGETKTEYVRLRNISLDGPEKLILQVGLVVDRNFLEWEIVDKRVIGYITGIIVALFFASALLTHILLAPSRLLIGHLKEATSHLVSLKDVRPLPKQLTQDAGRFWTKSDEFSILVNTIQKLIDRINLNYKLTRSWTLQMAHELKTPLAIIRAETESKKNEGFVPPLYANDVVREVQNMSEIISQFLDWAELENSQAQRDLHALRMKNVIGNIASRLDKIDPARIQLELESDFSVLADPNHLDQLVTNLVVNALKFSRARVEMVLSDHAVVVRDYGKGIPKEVKERIGQPFNVGSGYQTGVRGNGLGLAWVSTIAKIYDWKLEIKSDIFGTEAIVHFPKNM